jgi:hypothetical protein
VRPVDDLDAFLRDLEMRGAAQTAETRALVADALTRRKLARCGLSRAPSSAVGMFTPSLSRLARTDARCLLWALHPVQTLARL